MTKDQIISLLASSYTEPLKLVDLAHALKVKKPGLPKLRSTVDDLIREGKVVKTGGGGFALPGGVTTKRSEEATGRIRVHPAGYGFVEREDGLGDVFVPAKYRGSAMDGDRVVLTTWDGYKGTEGKVIAVSTRGRAKLTGILARAGRQVVLEPDDPRIATDYGRVTLEEGAGKGQLGQCVVVEITRYPTDAVPELSGRLVRVLGPPEDPNTEIEKILACEDIPIEFPEPALAQARAASQEVRERDVLDRIDLRDRNFMTIDPETARDFDDALCIEPGPHGGPRVWVAVADVSHYVRPNDPLDRESQVRGVSVYLPDRVIPMLPFELSSGICSLNPDVDRLAMVVRLDFLKGGADIKSTGFAAAVIRSRARLDYPGVAAALSGDFRGQRERYRQYERELTWLEQIARELRKKRMTRGALELEIPEAKVVLDADDPKLVRDVVQAKANPAVKGAYSLVEEFMIAANEAVGRFFNDRNLVTVWRVHAPPDEERLVDLARVCKSHGIKFDIEEAATPLGMQALLKEFKDTSAERALSFLALRSLKQAQYDTGNVGHFGLASNEYLHFTSPIRRYSDVLVHRALKAALKKEGQPAAGGPGGAMPDEGGLQELASLVSSHERRAIEVEREAVSMYRAYLMRDQVGEEYEGRVSAVTHFGVFVELDAPFVEGLIKYQNLGDDSYEYDGEHLRVFGKRTGFQLGLGDRVTVEVLDASIVRRQIDFKLISAETRPGVRHKPSRRGESQMQDRRGSDGRRGRRREPEHGEKPGGRRKKNKHPSRKGRPRRGRK